MAISYELAKLLGIIIIIGSILPTSVILLGSIFGRWIQSRTQQRRELLLNRATTEANKQTDSHVQASTKFSSSNSLDDEWEQVSAGDKTPPISKAQDADESFDGIIGFFHPFCNAGGGGERVLFAAILATQQQYPNALCIVYAGDHDVSKEQILTNARTRFNIELNPARVTFLYLTTRDWVLASKYPHFTLLGQSLGSLVLGWDAFNLLVPDILIDTMGYAFVLGLSKWLFPSIPTAAYVHYPTISTDMISSLQDDENIRGLNAGSGKGTRGKVKQWYWQLFAKLYSWVGGHIDVVMTNSSWTQRHIGALWGPARARQGKKSAISIVFPPCAVEELHEKIKVDSSTEKQRQRQILYISQFRPEKMHQTVISAFYTFINTLHPDAVKPKLMLVGSVRDDQDEKGVYKLRLQALEIKEHVEFVVNAKWPRILDLLKSSSVGVNGMWNEHFGIGVVEYQAAGLISVVNDSGGPKEDIVVDIDGGATGFHASTIEEYAQGFNKALSLSPEDALEMRYRARKNSLRFSEEVFGSAWSTHLHSLVELSRSQR